MAGVKGMGIGGGTRPFRQSVPEGDRVEGVARSFTGSTIRALRVAAKMSQADLGKTAGLSGKYIGELERCVKGPGFDVLVRLARALRVSPRVLLPKTLEVE